MSADLTDPQVLRLRQLITDLFNSAALASPDIREAEPAFTARVLAPALGDLIRSVAFRGLHVSGDGAAPIRTVHSLGLPFRPDLGVSHFARWLVAVEVKILRGAQRQNSVATAFGQGLVYRAHGFESVIVFLIDMEGKVTASELAEVRAAMSGSFDVIVRRRAGSLLV